MKSETYYPFETVKNILSVFFPLLASLCRTMFYGIKNQGIKVVGCLEMLNLRLSHLIRDLYVRIGWSCKSRVSTRRRSNAKILLNEILQDRPM